MAQDEAAVQQKSQCIPVRPRFQASAAPRHISFCHISHIIPPVHTIAPYAPPPPSTTLLDGAAKNTKVSGLTLTVYLKVGDTLFKGTTH